MILEPARLCVGEVVHKRLRPKQHSLKYPVFSLLLDVDRIDDAARTTKGFARNRFAPASFHDADHGADDGTSVGDHARALFYEAGLLERGADSRVLLLCYPRIFGYVFNPLSVFYAFDKSDTLTGLIYEVNNTFKERTSYVIPCGEPLADTTGQNKPQRVYAQSCSKQMFVSPFASQTGSYGFRISHPEDGILVGVNFRDADGPLLRTHFKAEAVPLTTTALNRALVRMPLMTLKVMAAIHYEAARLWIKGVPLVRGQSKARYSISYADR
ncbi:MAG: DUF1365 domain-containing protein [Pseudomonadota bacterium]